MGLPETWLGEGGVTVRDLPTPYGDLSYTLRREGGDIVMDLVGDVAVPAGGLVLRAPVGDRGAKVGTVVVPAGREVVIRSLPQHVVWAAGK